MAEEAEYGDELCTEIILGTAKYLAIGIVNLMHTIDPDGILLGGAMTFGGHDSPLGRRFLELTKAEVKVAGVPGARGEDGDRFCHPWRRRGLHRCGRHCSPGVPETV